MAMVMIMNFLGNILFKICTNKERIDDEKKRYICLGDDIVMEILLRLPVKVLLQCKCLSKHWFQLISSSYFRRLQHEWAKTHQNRILYKIESDEVGLCLSSLDINNNNCNNTTTASYSFSSVLPQREFHILGSCDGLVCLFDYKSIMVLCNPTTKECVEVPLNIEQVLDGYNRWFDFKFGYDPVTDKYKVVRLDIYLSTTDLGYTEVYVYTLGSKVWRKIPTVFRLANSHYASYVHGAFHRFKLTDDSTWNDQGIIGIDDSSIISFDVGSEEFGTIPWINNNMAKSGDDTANKVVLGVLQECLSVSHKYSEEGSYYIWLMKDYGVKESWTKVFSFSFKGSSLYNCVPIIVMENGELIIQHGETGKLDEKGNLYTYNIQKRTIGKAIPIVAWRTACIFVESLVSISSIGTQVDGNMG